MTEAPSSHLKERGPWLRAEDTLCPPHTFLWPHRSPWGQAVCALSSGLLVMCVMGVHQGAFPYHSPQTLQTPTSSAPQSSGSTPCSLLTAVSAPRAPERGVKVNLWLGDS